MCQKLLKCTRWMFKCSYSLISVTHTLKYVTQTNEKYSGEQFMQQILMGQRQQKFMKI